MWFTTVNYQILKAAMRCYNKNQRISIPTGWVQEKLTAVPRRQTWAGQAGAGIAC